MVGLTLSVVGSATSSVIAARELIRTNRLAPPLPASFRDELASGDPVVLTRGLTRVFRDDASDLAAAILSREARLGVSLLNEALGQVDRELSSGVGAARSATRVAVAMGTLGGVVELIGALSTTKGGSGVAALVAFAVGMVGAGACFEFSRRAAARSLQVRAEWDRVAAEVGRRL